MVRKEVARGAQIRIVIAAAHVRPAHMVDQQWHAPVPERRNHLGEARRIRLHLGIPAKFAQPRERARDLAIGDG